MTDEALRENIEEVLQGLDDQDLVMIHNEYCYSVNRDDDEIFTMDRFDEFYEGSSALDVAYRVFFGSDEFNDNGSFNPNRDYFYLNGYGNPVSLDYVGYNRYSGKWMCDRIDVDDIIDDIIDNDKDYGLDEIREALDEAKEAH